MNTNIKKKENILFTILRMNVNALKNAKYAYLNAGILAALYYFLTRFFMPLGLLKNYKNKIKQNQTNSKKLNELIKSGYTQIKSYSSSDIDEIVNYFLKKISVKDQISYQNLNYYFNFWRSKGEIRPNGIFCDGGDNPISKLVRSEEIIEIISNYLGLAKDSIYYYAQIDSLICLNNDNLNNEKFDGAIHFHRDADALKFVKVFIYLTDCFDGDGHHEYILGSHAKFPLDLVEIRRYSEKEIFDNFDKNKHIKVIGEKGTAFIENTLGFHRGTKPIRNDRLALIICYMDKITSRMHPQAQKI